MAPATTTGNPVGIRPTDVEQLSCRARLGRGPCRAARAVYAGLAPPPQIQQVAEHALDVADLDSLAAKFQPAVVLSEVLDMDVVIGGEKVQRRALAAFLPPHKPAFSAGWRSARS